VPLSTVKGRLFKSRRRLRGELAAQLDGAAAGPRRPPPKEEKEKAMPQEPADYPVRLVLDREALIDELHAYVTDPSPSRTRRLERLVIPELVPLAGRPEPVRWGVVSTRAALRLLLDALVLDGVTHRRDVAAVLGGFSLFSHPFAVTVV
jgi:hypothetical protein